MNRIKQKIVLASLSVGLLFLYFNLLSWQMSWLGFLLLVFYLLVNSWFWQAIWQQVFGLNKRSGINKVFSWLTTFFLLSFSASFYIVVNRLTSLLIWFCFLITSVVTVALYFWIKGHKYRRGECGKEKKANLVLFGRSWILLAAFFALWISGFFFLVVYGKGDGIFSPWQNLHPYSLLIFFGLLIISGILLFSKYKTKTLLLVFVLFSFLIHMYLPYSSIYPWGGDAWRHIGIESKIQDGEQILPVLVGNDAEWVEVVGIDLPKVLVYPQKYTYTQFWASVVVVNEVMQSDLIFVHRWLGPFVWSLVMPLLLFRIGRLLFGSRRKGLWLPWLMFLFFPFQALGGLTLPVSLGYLTFFFVIMMWLQYVRDGLPWQKRIALLFSVLMVFGYTLHFILIWLLILFTLVVRRIAKIEKTELQYTSFAGLFLLSWFVFPVIELVGKMSFVPEKIEWWNNLKQLIGQFFGWFYASSIRPHDILSGNILFNHTPGWAFVPSIFNSWRWWIIPLMILIILATKFAFFQAWKPKSEFKWKMVILFTGTVVGSYIISWFVLEGDRSLVRRMDLFLTLAIAVLLIYTIQYFLVKLDLKKLYTRIIILIGIFALSWFGALAYASGPDLRVVDHNEYIAANHIWDEMGQEKPYCVLADTWPLLVLEGVSGREVVGGGFPIDNQFAQPERVDLFTKLINREVIDLEWMGELTGAEKCWFLRKRGESEELDEESGEVWINNFVVWEQGLKKVVK